MDPAHTIGRLRLAYSLLVYMGRRSERKLVVNWVSLLRTPRENSDRPRGGTARTSVHRGLPLAFEVYTLPAQLSRT